MKNFSIAGLQLNLASFDNRELLTTKIKSTVSRYPWVNMIVLSELANSLNTIMFTQGYLETVLFILVVSNSLLSKLAKFSCKPAIEKFFTRKL